MGYVSAGAESEGHTPAKNTGREPKGNPDLFEEVHFLPSDFGEKNWSTVLLLVNERKNV